MHLLHGSVSLLFSVLFFFFFFLLYFIVVIVIFCKTTELTPIFANRICASGVVDTHTRWKIWLIRNLFSIAGGWDTRQHKIRQTNKSCHRASHIWQCNLALVLRFISGGCEDFLKRPSISILNVGGFCLFVCLFVRVRSDVCWWWAPGEGQNSSLKAFVDVSGMRTARPWVVTLIRVRTVAEVLVELWGQRGFRRRPSRPSSSLHLSTRGMISPQTTWTPLPSNPGHPVSWMEIS